MINEILDMGKLTKETILKSEISVCCNINAFFLYEGYGVLTKIDFIHIL